MDLLASLPPGAPAATDVVSRKIIIDGKALSEAVPVAQVTINRTFNKITSARLVLLDGDAAEQDFSLSNENKFKPGSKIKIQLGYHGEVETVFEGIIVKHSIKIRQQGGSLLIIDAKDNAIKMTLGRKSRYFTNKTDKEAIEEIAEKFKPKVEDTVLKHKQLLQFECTDWDFIVTRAEANGMLVLCD